MLEDIMNNNKLEYIHINTRNEYNILKPMTLSHNIMNLKYFYVNYSRDRVVITLDIS